MTNEQFALMLRLLSERIGAAVVECEDLLPADMATPVKNILGYDRTYYVPTIPIWRIVEDLDKHAEQLEKV